MKRVNLARSIRAALLTVVAGLVVTGSVFGQSDWDVKKPVAAAESRITIRENQVAQLWLKAGEKDNLISITNPTDQIGDVDVVVFDEDGNELDRITVELWPQRRVSYRITELFPELDLASIDSTSILVSLRSPDIMERAAVAGRTLPIAFFSQVDPRWANNRVGLSGYTIKQIGCAMTSVTMAGASKMTNLTPGTMNAYLSLPGVGGYTSDGSIYWNKPPNYQPSSGFRYIGSTVNGNSTIKTAAALKALIDGGNYVVASSTRYTQHWVVIYKYNGTGSKLSDFEYLDPADANYVRRTVDDGKVKATSQIRVYK